MKKIIRTFLLGIAVLFSFSRSLADLPPDGVYKVKGGKIMGEDSEIENILELVTFNSDAQYFRLHTETKRGCVCGLWGVARKKGDHLEYQGKEPNSCSLSIFASKDKIEFNADKGDCCKHCGGSALVSFPLSKGKPIKYLEKLKNSRQYKEAESEFLK